MRGSPPGKIALALLAKKPDSAPDDGDGGGDGGGSDLEAAAQDLMDALKGGSAADVASALKSAFTLMESQPHDEAGE